MNGYAKPYGIRREIHWGPLAITMGGTIGLHSSAPSAGHTNTHYENPNYESGNGQVWGYYVYQGQAIGGHYCIDEHGNYIL